MDVSSLRAWLRDVYARDGQASRAFLPAQNFDCWDVVCEDVRDSIAEAINSLPGPDRILYRAWRSLGDLGVDALHEAILALNSEDGMDFLRGAYDETNDPDDHNLNFGILCCLPKVASGQGPSLGEFFTASSTRKLSIVNTENRLMVNAARIHWEKVWNEFVSDMQRGFLRGRSMVSNVVDIDEDAVTVSLAEEGGAIFLFDFALFFPSVSMNFLERCSSIWACRSAA